MIFTPRQFRQRAEFYHQLAQLTAACMGVIGALQQVGQHPPGRSFRAPISRVLAELEQGKTFSESLKAARWLPDFDLALIDAGEQSGRLDSCFRALMDYYNERAVIARQMIVQLIYPVILVHFAVLVFLIVLPFAGSQFHASLPFLFLKAALVLLPFYAVTVALIYAMQNKRGERWRSLIESAIAWIPVLGGARRCLALARLAMALEALLSAGVNVIEAWEIAARVSSSAALGRVVERWKTRLMAGSTPAELIQATPLFPGPFASLYASGEVSGKLDETLNRLHVYYQEEGSHKLQMLAQWVPRAIYFIVALIIAYNIIQFYTGYFRQAVNVGF